MSWVFPGVCDVLARSFLFIIALMREDFPTLDLPIKAYSASVGSGQFCHFSELFTNSTVLMIIVSEETGSISVAYKGQFYLRLSAEELESLLTKEI
jgi:hypothetical protein